VNQQLGTMNVYRLLYWSNLNKGKAEWSADYVGKDSVEVLLCILHCMYDLMLSF